MKMISINTIQCMLKRMGKNKMLSKNTINKRILKAIKTYIPHESDYVKRQIYSMIECQFTLFEIEQELNDDGKPYTSTQNLNFAISITLDDMDTPYILEELHREEQKRIRKNTL